ELKVPANEVQTWLARQRLAGERRPIVTPSPGAVGAGKAWPVAHYAEWAKALAKDGASVWILGGPSETSLAKKIIAVAGDRVRDLTGSDFGTAILRLAEG